MIGGERPGGWNEPGEERESILEKEFYNNYAHADNLEEIFPHYERDKSGILFEIELPAANQDDQHHLKNDHRRNSRLEIPPNRCGILSAFGWDCENAAVTVLGTPIPV